MTKRYLLSCFFSLLIPVFSFAQQSSSNLHCASDEMMRAKPELMALQKQLEDDLLLQRNAARSSAEPPYMLPVVVHIIHQNGSENIPDARVFDAIEHLNQAFAHGGYYAQQGDGTNTQIQFCLARRTPDGQLTNGITRTESPLTDLMKDTQDQTLKDLIRWDPTQYVNIWIVGSISSASSGPGVAGYAYLASSHGQPHDGLVCEAQYFGADAAQDGVLIHEMGHYLNLYHTFEGGCSNGDCLASGDRVCDTPPDQTTHTTCPYNSCDTDTDDASANNPFGADVDDMTENFMDYSPFSCYRNFSEGQAERMHFAIAFYRSSLLESEGCKDPCSILIAAAFSPSATNIQAGQTVNFTNQTVGATNYEWYVNGNLAGTTTDFSHQFTGTGNSIVELRAYNADPNCLSTAAASITVQCGVDAAFTVNSTELEIGETFVGTNTSTGATSYQWFINGVDAGMTTNLNYPFNNAGLYTVMLEASGSFCSDFASQIINVSNDPCPDSIAGFYYQLTNASVGAGDYLSFFDLLPNGDFYLNAYSPYESGMVIKMEPTGNVQWRKRIDIPVNGMGTSATEDGGTIGYYTWNNYSEYRICKIDSGGSTQWVRSVTNTEDTWVSAFKNGAVIFDDKAIPAQLRMVVLDENGDAVVNKTYTIPDGIEIQTYSLTADSAAFWIAGHVVKNHAKGAFVMKIDMAGNLLFMRRYYVPELHFFEFRDVKPTLDGGFIATGRRSITIPLDNDFIILKGDADGNIMWSKMIGMDIAGMVDEIGHQVFTKPGGGYIGQYNHFSLGQLHWFSFSEDGELEYIKKVRFEDGDPFHYRIFKSNDKFYVAGNGSNIQSYLAEFDPATGPKLGCMQVQNFTAKTFELNLLQANSDFSPTSNPLNVAGATLDELPIEHNIIKTPFCAIEIACPEVCDNSLDDDDDGYVDCFDAECQCFSGNDCSQSQNAVLPISGKVAWMSGADQISDSAVPIVANLNPQTDNIPEIIVIEGTSGIPNPMAANEIYIFKGDGSNKNNPDVLTTPVLFATAAVAPTVADVNNDGIPELLMVCTDGYIRVYTNFSPNSTPVMEWMTTSIDKAEVVSSHIGLADFDEDGIPEIYIDNDIFKFNFINGNVSLNKLLDGTGNMGRYFAWEGSKPDAVDILSVTDCNGDPDCEGLELVAGAYIYSVDTDILDGDGVQIKVQRNLNSMTPGYTYSDGKAYCADMDLDGILDIVTIGSRNSQEGFYIWNKNGIIAFYSYPYPNFQYGTCAIANVYDDTKHGLQKDMPEIIAAGSGWLTCFNLQAEDVTPPLGAPYWWKVPTKDNSKDSSPSCFDFDADGFAEVLYRDEDTLHVLYGGAAPLPPSLQPNRHWFSFGMNSATADDYPVIADVDADGEAEIVVAGKIPQYPVDFTNLKGRLWVIESDSLPWAPSRSLWNQYNYNPLYVNDDLTIPQHQQAHHLEFPSLGSGNRPFNNAQTQQSAWDGSFNPAFPVADATVTVDSFACDGDDMRVWITLCNTGSNVIPANFPIAFYKNDPRLPGADIETSISHGPTATPVDSCVTILVTMPTVLDAPIFVVVGDDVSQNIPYTIADFPISDILECNYENNFASFVLNAQSLDLDLGPDRSLCSSSVTQLNAGAGFTSYRWQDGSTDSTYTAFGPGTYWVDALDICGFLHTDTLVISLNQTATVDLGNDRSICAGEAVTLSVTGFAEVQWYPEAGLSCATCPTTTAAPSDTITYYVTAANGDCFASDSVRIFAESQPTVDMAAQDGNCSNTAVLTANASGNAPFIFLWSNGETTQAIHPTQAGTYTVTVTSGQGCSATTTAAVEIDNSLLLDIVSIPVPCAGSFGEAAVEASGGLAPYNYEWSNGEVTPVVQVATPGNFTVTVTDVNGCVSTSSVTVGSISSMSLDLQSQPLPCAGAFGEASVAVNGGTAPYTYEWSNGEDVSTIPVAASGDLTVTVTDANGCTSTGLVTVQTTGSLTLGLASSPVSCSGVLGEASVVVNGGLAPYSYEWSNGEETSVIQVAVPGDFTVTITDANGCVSTGSVTVGSIGSLLLDVQSTPVSCTGSLGGAAVAVSGGVAPYSYEWSNGEGTPAIQVAVPGDFTVTITDVNGCVSSGSATVGLSGQLLLGITVSPITCHDSHDGMAAISPINGTAPFEWLWQGGQTDSMLVGLGQGSYTVSVTDAVGCTDELSFAILAPTALDLSASGTAVSCFGGTDGTATVSAGGGTPGYQYFWSNFQTAATAVQLGPGWHTVTVTDLNGCTDTTGVLLTAPAMLLASVQVGDPVICQGDDTALTAAATGGTPPFSFLWNNGQADSLLTGIAAGTYIVTVTDANGCTRFASGAVQAQPPFSVVLDSSVPTSTPAASDGAIFVNVASGIPPFTYLWSNGATTQDIEGVPAGSYSLTVTDVEGCEQVYSFTVDFLNATSQGQGMEWGASIFPNPAWGGAAATLSIRSAVAQVVDYQLFDVTGKSLHRERLQVPAGGLAKAIALPDVAGMYLVVLSNEQEVVGLKWVVLF